MYSAKAISIPPKMIRVTQNTICVTLKNEMRNSPKSINVVILLAIIAHFREFMLIIFWSFAYHFWSYANHFGSYANHIHNEPW